MSCENIIKLTKEFEQASIEICRERDVNIKRMQKLIQETYRLFTQYHKDETVPKEMCKLFVAYYEMVAIVAQISNIDELSTSSDIACFTAISMIFDELEYGILNGKYDCAYPLLRISDIDDCVRILDLEKDFLEMFIEACR